MTLGGPQVLASLDEALRDIRREEDESMRKLGRSAERVAKLRETESELLPAYAEDRLEPARVAALRQAMATALATGREALRQRTAEIAALTEQLAARDGEQAALAARRAAALGDIGRQQAALGGLSGRIAQIVARDPGHAQQRAAAAQLRDIAAAAQGKARQAELAHLERSRAYARDPLFAYLLRRRYGTAAYAARGPARVIDGWVARVSGFATAHRHYLMGEALPARLKAHATALAEAAEAAAAGLDDLERAAIDAAGGATVRLALEEAQQRIAAIDAQLIELQAARNAATAAQQRLASVDDPAFERAVDALVRALGAPDLAQLIQAARGTGSEDPRIVQLADIGQRIAEEGLDTAELQARLATLAARRRELEDIEAEFKALRFDDPRSLFDDDTLTGPALDAFLTGSIDADGYWSRFRRSQGWSTATTEWGGGIGLPRASRPAADPMPPPEPAAATAAEA